MSKNTTHTNTNRLSKPSALDSFNLSFEYDVSWSEAKKSRKDPSA